jgi:hypothetical protein
MKMVNYNKNRSFYIVSSITEDRGHLLLDDFFWFRNLSRLNYKTNILTSSESAAKLKSSFPNQIKNIASFPSLRILKRINFRIYTIIKLLFSDKIQNSHIIIQGFDEIAIIFYLIKLRKLGNKIYLVPTNNISPERILRSKALLRYCFNLIINKSDYFLYHSDFELNLLKSFCEPNLDFSKCYKIKYHLLGVKCRYESNNLNDYNTFITYFGPVMESKPYNDICKLIIADYQKDKMFRFRFINVDKIYQNEIRNIVGFENENLIFINEYLAYDAYINYIATSKYVFLPHNFLYEGKLSGIFSDCVSNNVPVISDKIEPIIEFFDKYGDLGYMFDFSNDNNWPINFLLSENHIEYSKFKISLENCRLDHSESIIVKEFLSI